ncbi:MAG: hypothetical protein GXO76_03065 [Calditrichaeota bacterium]|nr:hypothetical protein [Calditrichota bacterium]
MSSKEKENAKSGKRRHHRSFGSLFKLFFVYFIVILVVFAWLDYYMSEFLNPILFVVFSLLIAAVATFVHVRVGKKSEVDDLAEKL